MGALVLTLSLLLGGMLIGDRTMLASMAGMPMTHYMGLLMTNQPLNLLWFMALPALLIEYIAIGRLVVAFRGGTMARLFASTHWACLLIGPLQLSAVVHVLLYLVPRIVAYGLWRGPADVAAIVLMVLSAFPAAGLTLDALGLPAAPDQRTGRRRHAAWMAAAMALTHLTMIVGMLDPTLFGWVSPGGHVHR